MDEKIERAEDRPSARTKLTYDQPDPSLLETFPNPLADGKINRVGAYGSISIEAPEFSSLCPITGQPDFGLIAIEYSPDRLCLESKSLKLYLLGFRMHGSFHEEIVTRVLNDLVEKLDPYKIKVEGRFAKRGGISFWPVAQWKKKYR